MYIPTAVPFTLECEHGYAIFYVNPKCKFLTKPWGKSGFSSAWASSSMVCLVHSMWDLFIVEKFFKNWGFKNFYPKKTLPLLQLQWVAPPNSSKVFTRILKVSLEFPPGFYMNPESIPGIPHSKCLRPKSLFPLKHNLPLSAPTEDTVTYLDIQSRNLWYILVVSISVPPPTHTYTSPIHSSLLLGPKLSIFQASLNSPIIFIHTGALLALICTDVTDFPASGIYVLLLNTV